MQRSEGAEISVVNAASVRWKIGRIVKTVSSIELMPLGPSRGYYIVAA